MKQKLSEYIADFFVEKGIKDVFMITGGGAMHLNDALGHHSGLHCTYNHHEQACAIAAEGYARLTGRIAAVCVTSGPGGTNAITGVLGAWQDSIPMMVISGQVKRATTTWSTEVPLRQLGDQEYQITEGVSNMTKYSVMVTDENEIAYHLEKAYYLAMNGRPGPVWLDIPLDVQAAVIDTNSLIHFSSETAGFAVKPVFNKNCISEVLERIHSAMRPLILAGTGINVAGARDEFLKCIEKLGIPVVTAWNAHDLLAADHPLFVGKPGTVGTRGGNFIVQKCDLLLVLGCRMNIRMISYNEHQFAKNAYKIVVDIDENELKKPTVKVDMPVCADVKDFMNTVAEMSANELTDVQKNWLAWCRATNAKYPACLPEYYEKPVPMNPYAFFNELYGCLSDDDVIVCGNGSACVMGFQTAKIKQGQRLFTNSGCAAMGYGFPAAIGACVARQGRRVICVDGDGSFQMNLQELQTVVYNDLNLKLFYLNNSGYHSIRQTQHNLFKGRDLIGVSEGNGISFPEAERLAYAYGIPFVKIDDIKKASEQISELLDIPGAVFCEVVVDPSQEFAPKLSSRVLEDGTIVSAELDDMAPFLPREEIEAARAWEN